MNRDERGLVAVLCTLVLISVANTTSAAIAQPAIKDTFGAGIADVGWVIFGHTATFAAGTVLSGALALRFGARRVLGFGIVLFSIAAGIAAAAPTMQVLVSARLVQGLGAGAIPTLSSTVIVARFEGESRSRALGAVVAAVGIGQAIGPLLGGLLIEVGDWHAALAIGVLAAPAAWPILKGESTVSVQEHHFDWYGAVLLIVATLSAAFLLNRLPLMGLTQATVGAGAALVVGGSALAGHVRRHEGAIIRRDIVGDPKFIGLAMLGAAGMSAYLGTIVLVPIAASYAHGLGGIWLSLLLLPMAITTALVAPQNRRFEVRLGSRGITAFSLAGIGGSALFIGLLGPATHPWITSVALTLLGVGFSLLGAPLVGRLVEGVPVGAHAMVLGSYNLCFFFGGVAGGAISTGIVQAGIHFGHTDGILPGFTTAQLALTVAPLAAASWLLAKAHDRPRGEAR